MSILSKADEQTLHIQKGIIMKKETVKVDRRRVDVLMERAGILTYTELAQKSGVHSNTLVRALQGGGWQSKTLADLSRALRCSPLDLIVADGFPSPSLGEPGHPLPKVEEPKGQNHEQ